MPQGEVPVGAIVVKDGQVIGSRTQLTAYQQ